ncbi:MAG TPA: GNAT family N-acetyltransferase [Pseudolabrys sp.]|nr:GNAT family N-acetyltransferase [Pseudolabrys sp.]
MRDGTRVLIRALRPQDAALYPDFIAHVTADDMRLRLFGPVREIGPEMIERLTHFDPAHAFALIAIDEASGHMLGVVRLHNDPDDRAGEFAVQVRSHLKGQGLGWMLMQQMIAAARQRGVRRIHGQVLRENVTMLQMCRELGFHVSDDPDDTSVEQVTLPL